MGLLDVFVKKEAEEKIPPKESGFPPPPRKAHSQPVQWIVEQKNKGAPEESIVAALTKRGYTPLQIDEAMKKARVLVGEVEPIELPPAEVGKGTPPFADSVQPYVPTKEMAEIENLIDDRVKKIKEDIQALQNWKLTVDGELDKLRASVDQVHDLLKESRDREQEKFEEYDKHLSEVKVELKATQEVFRKGLPEFLKAVQDLQRMGKRKEK